MDPNKNSPNNGTKNNKNGKGNKNLKGVLTLVVWAVVLTVIINYLSAYAGNSANKATSHEVDYSYLWDLIEEDKIETVVFENNTVYATPSVGFVFTDEKGKEYTHTDEATAYEVADRVLKLVDEYGFTDRIVINSFDGKLNEYIARNEALEWGKLRTGSVGISGTDYIPPVPAEDQTRADLDAILTAETTATAKALEAFVWGARGQFFWDGNKRTSMTLANKILIAAGAGFLTITDRHMERFNELLVNYYNTGDSETLKDFLYENAIQGIA